MTNRQWLMSLSDEDLAATLCATSCEICWHNPCCNGESCPDGIIKWLKAKRIKPMPELQIGDCIYFQESSNVYQAFCIHGNTVYCIDNGRIFVFEGKLKEDTVAILRYNVKTGTLEDIWRTDNG